MYDWANSAYALVILSTIFPVYYSATAINSDGGDLLNLEGWEVKNTVLLSYLISGTFLIVAFLSPALSGFADSGGFKKKFLTFFCLLGSAGCFTLSLFTQNTLLIGLIGYVMGLLGFCCSILFINSFLPLIAKPEDYEYLSGKGFSYGYLGSVILQALVLVPIFVPSLLPNFSTSEITRLAFAGVGLWWLGFGYFASIRNLPEEKHPRFETYFQLFKKGFKQLRATAKKVKNRHNALFFLLAFFFYNMGVQTVMLLATLFGDKEMHIAAPKLIATILGLQLVAIPGAMGFANVAERYGNRIAITAMLVLWILITQMAYVITNEYHFYLLALAVGLVMGGIQSISRATFARCIPKAETNTATWFSFYEFTEKISVVGGTFAFGFIEQLTGNMRMSALFLSVFFMIGTIIVQAIDKTPQDAFQG